ncbi:hypothetical protein HDK77DRAFT_429338 [Phyllosticta capitalensis]
MEYIQAILWPRDGLYENKGPSLSAITSALLVLASVFTMLRFTARWTRGVDFGVDDWMTLGSLLFCYGAGGLNYGMIAHGLGQHAKILDPKDIVIVLKLLMAFECVYCTGVGLVKLSVVTMYARIFPLPGFRIGAYILGFMTVGWVIAINCVSIFQCTPIKGAWDTSVKATCIDLKASFIGNAIPNILTDVAILAMPVGQVFKLQVTTAQKISLCVMFLLGSFVLFASIYRFTTIMQFQTSDTTWTLATACTWCVVEVACGIISACLPTLRPLMRAISSQFGSSMGRSKATPSQSRSRSGFGTELVTIGGTGATRSKTGERHFKRLDDMFTTNADEYGQSTTVVERSLSHQADHNRGDSEHGDEVPLKRIEVTVVNDVQWSERSERSGNSAGSDRNDVFRRDY